MVQHLYMLYGAHHKCSCHQPSYVAVIVSLTIFPMLCLLFCTLFIPSLGACIPTIFYPFCPSPHPLPSDNYQVCSLYFRFYWRIFIYYMFVYFEREQRTHVRTVSRGRAERRGERILSKPHSQHGARCGLHPVFVSS